MKKVVRFQVTITVDDNGEFDSTLVRDAIQDGLFVAQNEGTLTRIDDESTLFHSFNVSHISTLPVRAEEVAA